MENGKRTIVKEKRNIIMDRVYALHKTCSLLREKNDCYRMLSQSLYRYTPRAYKELHLPGAGGNLNRDIGTQSIPNIQVPYSLFSCSSTEIKAEKIILNTLGNKFL